MREEHAAAIRMGPRALERTVREALPGMQVIGCEPLGGDAGGVARKEGGYARAWRVTAQDAEGRREEVVFRVLAGDEFGHDRRADRAANVLLAFDTFAAIPDHVRALDAGLLDDAGPRSLRGAGEPYLLTTFAPGTLYAEDLRRVAESGVATALDLERSAALARWLAALHAIGLDDPIAWRRAIRDLVGDGEGIFGISDAYGAGVPAAPPSRLARIEHRCLDWRWRLQGCPERLRRTHGDFHPFNLVFAEGCRFTALDASRGCRGDRADDAVALSINYLFFALQAPGAWARGFGPLWRTFWGRYLEAPGARDALESAAPFVAWRALVLGCPRFYPDLTPDGRDALLGFAEQALEADTFDPAVAEDLFR